MTKNRTKQKVIQAASLLFYRKGFHGTTVREIAKEAMVNVSLISYYFNNKQGLLEYAVIQYYEDYFKEIDLTLNKTQELSAINTLKEIVLTIIQYKQEHQRLSSFIHRELSLDSIFVREMAVTYIAKENYLLKGLLQKAVKDGQQGQKQEFLFMQLKGMLITPYVLHNEWKDQIVGNQSHQYFIREYVKTIHKWLDFIVSNHDVSLKHTIENNTFR